MPSKVNSTKREIGYTFIYTLISELNECVYQKQREGIMSKYEMSKLAPALEKVLAQACDTSGKY